MMSRRKQLTIGVLALVCLAAMLGGHWFYSSYRPSAVAAPASDAHSEQHAIQQEEARSTVHAGSWEPDQHLREAIHEYVMHRWPGSAVKSKREQAYTRNIATAHEELKEAEGDPSSIYWSFRLARSFHKLGLLDRARETVEEAERTAADFMNRFPPTSKEYRTSAHHLAQGYSEGPFAQLPRAIQLRRRIIATFPPPEEGTHYSNTVLYTTVYIWLANDLADAGLTEEAIAANESLLKFWRHRPHRSTAHQREDGTFSRAETEFIVFSGIVGCHRRIAQILEQRGDLRGALERYQSILEETKPVAGGEHDCTVDSLKQCHEEARKKVAELSKALDT